MGEWRYGSTHSLTELDRIEWSGLFLATLPPARKAPNIHCIGTWVGPIFGLDTVKRRKPLSPARNWTPNSAVIQPVTVSTEVSWFSVRRKDSRKVEIIHLFISHQLKFYCYRLYTKRQGYYPMDWPPPPVHRNVGREKLLWGQVLCAGWHMTMEHYSGEKGGSFEHSHLHPHWTSFHGSSIWSQPCQQAPKVKNGTQPWASFFCIFKLYRLDSVVYKILDYLYYNCQHNTF
jgi:hypothetical protein